MALTADQQLALDIIETEEEIVRESWVTILNSHPIVPELADNTAVKLLGATS